MSTSDKMMKKTRMKAVDERQLFETLKMSPLGKSLETSPEESAMWLDMNMMSSARGVKKVLNAVEKNVGKFPDYFYALNPVDMIQDFMRPSQLILKHVFEAVFKAGLLDNKLEDLEKLLEHAVKKRDLCKKKSKENIFFQCHLYMFEVYAELVMRLSDKIAVLKKNKKKNNKDEIDMSRDC